MNPLRVLNLKKGATKRDLLQAAAAALRERKYSVQDIALAQQALMDPAAQTAFEFVSFLDAGAPPPGPSGEAEVPAQPLEYLPIFEKRP